MHSKDKKRRENIHLAFMWWWGSQIVEIQIKKSVNKTVEAHSQSKENEWRGGG